MKKQLDENDKNIRVVDDDWLTIELNGKPVCRIKIVHSELDKLRRPALPGSAVHSL